VKQIQDVLGALKTVRILMGKIKALVKEILGVLGQAATAQLSIIPMSQLV
jgi:hypothetical protein